MKPRLLLSLVLVLLLTACQSAEPEPALPVISPVEPTPPVMQEEVVFPGEVWLEDPPETQGMDSAILAGMLSLINQRGTNIEGMMIVRNGVNVMEAYFNPYEGTEPHIIHSCTKSIVSTLIGIAIEQGFIEGVDQSIWDFFPEIDTTNFTVNKLAITIEDMLTMSSGLDCQDSYLYDWKGLRELMESENWSHYWLGLPSIHEPGTHFEYCNGGSYTLASILSRATGQTPLDFAQENLFDPLGITPGDWPVSPQGVNYGWGSLHLLLPDMARFGWLYLNEGMWDGEQIVPAEYISEAISPKITSGTLTDDYGYQWWISPGGYYMALGYQGQYIIVMPENDLVVAVVSTLPSRDFHLPESFFHSYILPAIQSDEAIADNPEAYQTLIEAIQQAAHP